MFVAIFDWMLSAVPGFMRPGVGWLLSGLRKMTGYISSLWNSVGNAFGVLYGTIAAVRAHLVTFASTVLFGLLWLRYVWVPAKVSEAIHAIQGIVWTAVAALKAEILGALHALSSWAQWAIGEVRTFITAVVDWAAGQLAGIGEFLGRLVKALQHVLSGPDALAEWLVGGMWRALLRYAFSQRDRIFNWLFKGSFSFTVWIAQVVEDMIVRML
jgi:phage-related protein